MFGIYEKRLSKKSSAPDDHMISTMVVPSATTSSRKIILTMVAKENTVNLSTISKCLATEICLLSYKRERIHPLTPSMTTNQLNSDKHYQDWTVQE
ncbi:hypothetical protein NPIL_170361 [Nephila pilipes]|uniref:Uncharacterized protein n=1 Tax=Nephila pilipes TaxID=299642 RepID=A0A8X6NYE9_NEPPI|nr:hypothetical protein NPIL_170361 [Nephila pilipes]